MSTFLNSIIFLSLSPLLTLFSEQTWVKLGNNSFLFDTKHSLPFISSNAFRSMCQHYHDQYSTVNPTAVKAGDFVFVSTLCDIDHYFTKIHPEIRNKYVLISHDGTCDIPGKHAKYLKDKKLIAWFTKNFDGTKHPKLFAIPIGFTNPHWPHGNTKNFHYIQKNLNKNIYDKNHLIYWNMEIGTCSAIRSRAHTYLTKLEGVYFANNKPPIEFLEDICRSKFVASPRGAGQDCHRTWEALFCGSIPIVKSSPLDILFKDLNVLIIKDWDQLPDTKTLNEIYKSSLSKPSKREKLFFSYWKEFILNKTKQLMQEDQ